MKVSEILVQINNTQGTNAKLDILRANSDNELLQKVLKYSLDTFIKFNVKKIPKVTHKYKPIHTEQEVWDRFFEVADLCEKKELSGNAAIAAFQEVFSQTPVEDEYWMRRVLLKKSATGLARTTTNKVFPGLIKVFKVQLAEKWSDKTASKLPTRIMIEPKLDGIRSLSVVQDGTCQMFSRSGKIFSNFDDTLGAELAKLPNGVYDGEIMSDNFTALMRQVRRKTNVDVSDSYLAIFDFVTLDEWETRVGVHSMSYRRAHLEKVFSENQLDGVFLVEQKEIDNDLGQVIVCQREWEALGYEGAMVKNPDAPYNFGRSDSVLKVKSFHDIDLEVIGFRGGTGKHKGKLGSILVDCNGVEVNVGSGFKDDQRIEVWENKDKYLGMTAECRYQEMTEDGSLRFPTFVHWRLDKS